MSLYGLAAELFADMDKIRAASTTTYKARKNQQQRGTSESGVREQLQHTGEGDLLPRFTPGGSGANHVPPTLELLEGCLNDVQQNRRSEQRRKDPFEPAPGQSDASSSLSQSSPASEMTSFTADRQANCSPRDQHASRQRSSIVGAATGSPANGDNASASTTATIVQENKGTMNRVPEQLGVWRAPPASISRSSSSSSDSGEPVEEEEVKVEGDVSTGTSKPKTTGALKPYQMGETSIQLLPKGTGSATDGATEERNGTNTDTDAAATASFVDFEREVQDWRLSDGREKASLRVRTNFASHLSEKYLCDILDPLPSSPIVCRLRREIARRIDSLAKGVEEGTPPAVASGSGGKGKNRDIREVGGKHVSTAPQFEQGDIGSKDKPARLFSKGGGGNSLPADGEHRAYSGSSANSWAGRSSMLGARSVRQGVAGSHFGSTTLTRRVKRPEEANNTSLQDELGSQITGSISEPVQGLHEMKRASAKLGCRSSTLETACRASETGRVAAGFPRVPTGGDGKRRGSSHRSSHPAEGEPRERAVRFLLGEKTEETKSNGVAIGEAVHGVSQTTQKQGKRDRSNATVRHEVEAETKTMEDGGCWTCVVCQTPNDELGGGEGCTTCGRRRRRQQRCSVGARLATIPTDNLVTGNSRRLGITTDRLYEQERRGINQHVESPFADHGTRTNKGASCEKNADTSAIRTTAAQSEHPGPYDISSFAKMRQATQPIVKARLGLTREIQSLISSIRR